MFSLFSIISDRKRERERERAEEGNFTVLVTSNGQRTIRGAECT